jgi:acyl-CoA dehydrogenase
MNFRLTDEQRSLQETARRYAQERLPELARECEKSNHAPDKAVVRDFAEMGFLGINVPESLGGLGLGNLEALLVLEEFGKVSSAVAFPVFESCVGPVRAIERFASESLKRRVVPAGLSQARSGGGLDVRAGRGLGAHRPYDPGADRGRPGRDQRHEALVLGRRPCRRLRRVLPLSDGVPGARGHRGGLRREGDTPGPDLWPAGAADGLPRRAKRRHAISTRCRAGGKPHRRPAGGFKKLMEAFDLERCGNATMAWRVPRVRSTT